MIDKFTLGRRALLGSAAGAAAFGLAGTASAQKPLVIGFIYVGPRDDYGYNQAHAEAAAILKKMPGVKVVEEEKVPETVAVQKSMESMINLDGATLLFPTSFGYFDPHMLKDGGQVPERSSSATAAACGPRASTRRTPAATSATSTRRQYLSGIVAGATSKSGKLGFVAAKPIPQVLRNINAFTLGRADRSTRRSPRQAIFTGDWSLPVKEAEATNCHDRPGRRRRDLPRRLARRSSIETAERAGIFTSGYHATRRSSRPRAT